MHRCTLLPLCTLAILPLVLGCPPREVEDTGVEADADADSDSDADADADTDADVDAPVWEGQITYKTTVDGEPVCDAVVALVGSPYTGPCISRKGDQCDFAYNIDATLVEDNGTAACTGLNPFYTYLEDQPGGAWFRDPVLAYWHAYSYKGYDFYTHLMLFGFGADYTAYGGGFYPGPYWYFLAYDGSAYYGTADYDYPMVLWELDSVSYGYSYYYNYYNYCPGAVASDATEIRAGAWTATGQIDTSAGFLLDVWGFTVSDTVTDPVYVNVDTVDAKTGCWMGAFLNKPDGCSDVFARSNIDCTFPVDAGKYTCPAIDLEGFTPGEYELVVYSMGWYDPAPLAGYQIRIDATYDPLLHPIADNIPLFGSKYLGKTALLVSGWGQPTDD